MGLDSDWLEEAVMYDALVVPRCEPHLVDDLLDYRALEDTLVDEFVVLVHVPLLFI